MTKIDWTMVESPQERADKAAQAEAETLRAGARVFLAETDWYVTRMLETAAAIPDDIKAARTKARTLLSQG